MVLLFVKVEPKVQRSIGNRRVHCDTQFGGKFLLRVDLSTLSMVVIGDSSTACSPTCSILLGIHSYECCDSSRCSLASCGFAGLKLIEKVTSPVSCEVMIA